MGKLGRNAPCWCGSGKKFKKCHYPQTPAESNGQTSLGSAFDLEPDEAIEIFGSFGLAPVDQTLNQEPTKDVESILTKIMTEKHDGTRPLPSSSLISVGVEPLEEDRRFLVDTCATLADQNWAGRGEMCIYFAVLIRHALNLWGYSATVELGKATYAGPQNVFEWEHAWVITDRGDLVDGNVDSMVENPFVPLDIHPKPYWGPRADVPTDRKFHKERVLPPNRDDIELDVENIREWKQALERELERYRLSEVNPVTQEQR